MMRTTKILSILFSLLQFLLFLKLIEYVRGSEANTTTEVHHQFDLVEEPGNNAERYNDRVFHPEEVTMITSKNDADTSTHLNVDTKLLLQESSTKPNSAAFLAETSRACPACKDDLCDVNATKFPGLVAPIIQLSIGLVFGLIWFGVFLKIWYFHTEPESNEGYAPSVGYPGTSHYSRSSSTNFYNLFDKARNIYNEYVPNLDLEYITPVVLKSIDMYRQ